MPLELSPRPIRLALRQGTVRFSGIDVVSQVDLDLRSGEIHALVGENGAGKSSAAKAIAGLYSLAEGMIELEGKPIRPRNPREALELGIALIHQEPQPFPDLTVAENIFVGNLPRTAFGVDWKRLNQDAQVQLDKLGGGIDPRAKASGLSIAHQQRLEIAAALAHDAKVWIFDETSAPLTPRESAELYALINGLKEKGDAILIVTHHLQEVFAHSDRIIVLRDGKKVAELMTSETSHAEVVRLMVGREVDVSEKRPQGGTAQPVRLEVSQLSGPGFHQVSLKVRAGEIVGIGGLVGAGRTELARSLFGITKPREGTIRLDGKPLPSASPADAMRAGMALVPEDRRLEGLLLPQSIAFNTTLNELRRLSPKGWLRPSVLDEETVRLASELNLRYRSPEQPVGELSGGNQQKVALAKALLGSPKVLILDEPTRGVDIGAKADVHEAIRALAREGIAVLVISSDLPELLHLSDRIYVMREGAIVDELPGNTSEDAVMMAATGGEA